MNGWEVFDTAVKIGLGTLLTVIGGLATLYLTRNHQTDQDRRTRTEKLLFDLGEDAQLYFYHLGELLSGIDGYIKRAVSTPAHEFPAIDRHLKELVQIRPVLSKITLRLAYLDAKEARKAFAQANDMSNRLRTAILFDKRPLTREEHQSNKTAFIALVEDFNADLGERFRSL